MKATVYIVITLAVLLSSGCDTSPKINKLDSGGRYQLIEIGATPYFLDQDTGTVYSIKQHPDGKFDINKRVGRVGYLKDDI
jgi:hypothetical protein